MMQREEGQQSESLEQFRDSTDAGQRVCLVADGLRSKHTIANYHLAIQSVPKTRDQFSPAFIFLSSSIKFAVMCYPSKPIQASGTGE